MSGQTPLSPEMKVTLALIVSWVVFLFAETGLALATGPADIYAAASLVVAVPYLLFLYFGLRRRRWAYLGNSVLSVLLVAAVPFTIQEGMPAIILWATMLSTLLTVLLAVEGYKSYLQLRP